MIHLKKPQLDQREYDAVLDVLKSGVIAQGPKVASPPSCIPPFNIFEPFKIQDNFQNIAVILCSVPCGTLGRLLVFLALRAPNPGDTIWCK